MRFPATVEPAGNATGIEVPAEIVTALAAGQRPTVVITINGYTWRSRVASTGGRFTATAHRQADHHDPRVAQHA